MSEKNKLKEDFIEEQNNNAVKKEAWHIGKEIPITLIFAIFLQTAGAFWWAATLTNKLDNLTQEITDFKLDKYSKNDAKNDLSIINFKIDDINKKIDILDKIKKNK